MFSTTADERSCAADSRGFAAAADVSVSTESASVPHDATGDEYLAKSAEVTSAAVVQNESLVDQNVSIDEGEKAQPATSVAGDLFEADCQELDYQEESEAEQLSEMPGTPASLPSLVSEPEDTCTPVKFPKVCTATSCTFFVLFISETGTYGF